MRPCEKLEGTTLVGARNGRLWKVTKRLKKSLDGSGGTFSVGYLGEDEHGEKVFIKSTDIGLLTQSAAGRDMLAKTQQAINEQSFEREILDICRGNNMDRVVHALDHGEIEAVTDGVRDYVFFIVFEVAQGDVRQQVDKKKRRQLSWALNALHNLAVALRQLHSARISHNDVKPSNLLIFDDFLQKLADLGRATSETKIGPWDGLQYAGDRGYSAPEFWYRGVNFPTLGGRITFPTRQASDLYLLGSMGYFFLAGEPLSPILRSRLRPEHNDLNWTGTYEDVLPYIRDAFGEAIAIFDDQLPPYDDPRSLKLINEFRSAILQLCDPDPRLRGLPSERLGGENVYSLEQYVSLFDRLAKQIAVRERAT